MTPIRSALIALLLVTFSAVTLGAQEATEAAPTAAVTPTPGVAHAVLFHSENCPHCADVIYRVLPDIKTMFGDKLEIIDFKTQDPYGQILFQMAYELFMPPDSGLEVPIMFIGDQGLLGVSAIRDEFPVLVQTYITQGGVDWPDIPGLRESIAQSQGPTAAPEVAIATETPEPTDTAVPTDVPPTATPMPTATPTPQPGMASRFLAGRGGQALGLLALVALLALVLVAVRRVGKRSG